MSPAPPGAHPSPEEVDALLDIDAPPDARVSAHVAACAECGRLLDGMRQVRQLLRAAAAAPPQVPADVQSRLQATLSRASAERSGTIVPLQRSPRPTARVPRWLAVAAGLAVLGGAGAAASQLIVSDRGQESASSAGAGAAEQGPPSEFDGVTASGTDYSADSLAGQVHQLLQRSSPAPEDAATAAPDPGAAPDKGEDDGDLGTTEGAEPEISGMSTPVPLAEPEALAGCLRALGAAGQTPLAADMATWQGEPAAVLVLPDASRPDVVQVWVVGPGCGQDGDELLHYQVVEQ